MSLLARFDPGDAVTALVLLCLVQTSVVILAAAVLWRHDSSRTAPRHGTDSGWEL